MSDFFRQFYHHLRWGNLLIIVLCLGVFRFKLAAIMAMHDQQLVLTQLAFMSLLLALLLLTLAGYWINDYFDRNTDAHNHKKCSQYALSAASLKKGAILFFATGFMFALAAAWLTDLLPWLLLFPLVGLSLWAYSRQLKGLPLVGNILIAALSGAVPLLLLIPEQTAIASFPASAQHRIGFVFLGFGLFAFGVSLFREIVKDLEDEAGDRAAGIRTLAVAWGERPAKVVALSSALVVAVVAVWLGLARIWPGAVHALFFVVAGLMLFLAFLLFRARGKNDYARISNATKALLVLGLLFVLLF